MRFLLHIAAIIDRDNHQVVRSQVLLYAAAGPCLSPCRPAWLCDCMATVRDWPILTQTPVEKKNVEENWLIVDSRQAEMEQLSLTRKVWDQKQENLKY